MRFLFSFPAFFFLLLSSCAFAQTNLLRGPYLQAATPSSIHIRWRTDAAEAGRVQWGTSSGNLTQSKDEVSALYDHEVVVTGLLPNTKYWYSIGSLTTVLQGNADNFFMTLPTAGTRTLLHIGVFGDCGNNSANQMAIRDHMQAHLGSAYMNAWILLGDNAYDYGLDAEYQYGFFNVYKDGFLKQSPVFPSPGNHDYSDNATNQVTHQISYYQNFTMPVNGEAGGVPSNNPAYYSYNMGNVHFISLDAFGKEDSSTRLYDTLGRQVQWLKQDLAANQNKDWVIAYWHHAPFTKGSHNSDTEQDLIDLHTNLLPILERYGVDLVLCGHSHVYERSKLQNGFYGYEADFNPAVHDLSLSSALYDGSSNSCPYVKDANNAGTVYVVSGSAGQLGGTSPGYPHNAMYYSNTTVGGAVLLQIEDNRLDAKWICSDGVIRDQFTMMKSVNKKQSININSGDSATLAASFIGTYNWSTGSASTKTIRVAPTTTTTYYVADAYNCLRDTFVVAVNNIPLPATWLRVQGAYNKASDRAQITWQTTTASDVDHFEVERSVDGNNFINVGSVAARNNSGSTSDYSFADATLNTALPFVYYRIRQVTQNGAAAYSPTIKVNLTASQNFEVRVVPNPSHGSNAKLRLLNASAGVPVTVSVADASGKTIGTKELMLDASPQNFMPAAPAGTYFVTVKGESFVRVITMTVQ